MTDRNIVSEAGFVGAAAVPHSPQMLSLPRSEDAAQVARVRKAMLETGDALRELKPDLIIVISNDHGDDFVLRSVPPFMFHCGMQAQGRDGHHGTWKVDGLAGMALVKAMMEEGFDPAFTYDAPLGTFFTIPVEFMGWHRDVPVLPLFVNCYVPPQPSPDRCLAFGQALGRAVQRLGKRAVLIASGGMSHYPGTAIYADPGPADEADEKLFESVSAGNLRALLGMDEAELDATGNIELRSWLILAGVVGQRKPDVALFEPNWHHNYGVFGWTSLAPRRTARPWYAAHAQEHLALAGALHALRTSEEAVRRWMAGPAEYAAAYALSVEEAGALQAMNEEFMRDTLGIHPLLTSGAKRHIEKMRKGLKE